MTKMNHIKVIMAIIIVFAQIIAGANTVCAASMSDADADADDAALSVSENDAESVSIDSDECEDLEEENYVAADTVWDRGNYNINSDMTINGNLNVTRDTTITLAAGKTLTINGWLSAVSRDGYYTNLTINGSGNLVVTYRGDMGYAMDGYITVNGGTVTVRTIENAMSGVITVNGGTLNVETLSGHIWGSGMSGNVYINGGVVNVHGFMGGVGGNFLDVTGGELNVISTRADSDGISSVNVTMTGGKVVVKSDEYCFLGNVNINGGTLVAECISGDVFYVSAKFVKVADGLCSKVGSNANNAVEVSNNWNNFNKRKYVYITTGSSNVTETIPEITTGDASDNNSASDSYVNTGSNTVYNPVYDPGANFGYDPVVNPVYDPGVNTGFEQTVPDVNVQNDNDVYAFVERMYSVVLGRDSEPAGKEYWSQALIDHRVDGAGIARGFVCSEEFMNKNLSNEDYVTVLYRTFLNREPDQDGYLNWVNTLNSGATRESVLAGFVNSTEFTEICSSYGIVRGTMEADGSGLYNAGVREFVERNYLMVLGREGETAGIESWCKVINTGGEDIQTKMLDVAIFGFFNSPEFLNKNVSDGEFVKICYRTFLGREYDQSGYDHWVGKLSAGYSRDEVVAGFAYSPEFTKIMHRYIN